MGLYIFHITQPDVNPWTSWVWTAQVHLYVDFFFFFSSVVDTIVLPIPDAELQIQGSYVYGGPASYKFYASFWLCRRLASLTPAVVQGSAAFLKWC